MLESMNSKAPRAYSIKKHFSAALGTIQPAGVLPAGRPPATGSLCRSLSTPVSCFQNKSSGEREPKITETQSVVFTDSQFML